MLGKRVGNSWEPKAKFICLAGCPEKVESTSYDLCRGCDEFSRVPVVRRTDQPTKPLRHT